MKGQDRTFSELTTDPWIYILAILIGLAVLFFFCATRVQADPAESASLGAGANQTHSMPVEHKSSKDQFKVRAWHGDYSDISNERAGNAPESTDPRTLKGTVKTGGKKGLLGSIMGFCQDFFGVGSTESSMDAPPVFSSP